MIHIDDDFLCAWVMCIIETNLFISFFFPDGKPLIDDVPHNEWSTDGKYLYLSSVIWYDERGVSYHVREVRSSRDLLRNISIIVDWGITGGWLIHFRDLLDKLLTLDSSFAFPLICVALKFWMKFEWFSSYQISNRLKKYFVLIKFVCCVNTAEDVN